RETGPGAVSKAVRVTFSASFWCMATTLLGFSSLLFVSAKPLRELGFAGAFGAAVAIAVAYGLYPAFLRPLGEGRGGGRTPRFPLRTGAGAVAAAAILTVVAAFGLPRLDTDPDMLSYFAAGSEIRTGIELVDENGGSSPLLIVADDGGDVGGGEPGGRLDSRSALERLARIQKAFDEDPAVGVSLSLPLLIAEARRVPVTFLLSDEKLVDLLDTENFDHIARSFITPDRTRTLFFLRMHEGERQESRRAVLERLKSRVTAEGFQPRLVGGLYELQAQLGELVRRSLLNGLAGLLVLFLVIAAVVGRSLATVLAMGSLVSVPILVLGVLGHLGRPLDVISSPAVNVAIALGIDSMIHLVLAVRRHRRAGDSDIHAWQAARDQLWQPIAGAMLILAAGFGIFGLSSFPPTQRFGLAVAGGTAAAAFMALFVLPWLATRIRAAAMS
ncbi:MAG: MMPL family transporter, partial [Thermoanaerobaculia bacterium]